MADFEDWRLRGDTEGDLNSKNESLLRRMVRLVFDDATGQYKGMKVGPMPGPTSYRDMPLDNVFTSDEKTKLAGIAEGAQANAVTSVHGRTGAVTSVTGDYNLDNVPDTATYVRMLPAERSKLASISPGAGEIFQGNWNASTNSPTLAGSGMTPGHKWTVTTGGTQFSRTFTTGHFAIVDSAGDLRDVPSNTFTPGAGQYTTAWVDDSADRRYVTDAQKTKIEALPAASAPSTHVGAGGTEHALATTSTAGFLAGADKALIDMSGFVVSETQPTLGDGKCWYKASTGRLHRWDATAARFWVIHAYSEIVPPTASNDAAAGFAAGCVWTDVSNGFVYVCRVNTNGAAKWAQLLTPQAATLGGGTGFVGATAADGTIGVKSLQVFGTTGAPAIASDANTVTVSVPMRPTGPEIIAAIDGELTDAWHAGIAPSVQEVIVPHVFWGNAVSATNMVAAENRFFGNGAIFKRDWRTARKIRFSRAIDGTFGAAGSKLYLKYSVNGGTTWTTIDGTDLALDDGTLHLKSSWVDVPVGAKTANTLVAVYGSGGDGVADPIIKNVMFEVSFPATTTAGVPSTAFQQTYCVLPFTVGWTAPSPEAELTTGRARQPADLSRVNEVQYSVECTVAASLATTRHVLKYSLDGGATWVEIPGADVSMNVTGSLLSGWVELPPAARVANAWFGIFGGNATTANQTAAFQQATIATRYRTITPLLDAASTLVWQPVTIVNAATLNWTSVPSGTALEVNSRMRIWYDTERTQKVIFRTYFATAGKAGSVGYIQYSTDAATWATLPGSIVAADSTGQKDTGEITLPGDAQAPLCWFRFVVDVPGTGTTSFGIQLTTIDFGTNLFAEVPWLPEGQRGTNWRGPSQTITESGQAIQAETVFLRANAAAVALPPASSGINECAIYCGRTLLSNIKPTGDETIDGVGPTGQDIMPYQWAKFLRDSGTVPSTWVELP